MTRKLALLALTAFAAQGAAAGVVFDIETVDPNAPEGQAADTLHTLVDGKRIKMNVEGPRGANADMIYRGDRREVMAVDHGERSYVLIDDATIDQIGAKLKGFEEQMREAMKDVPPEQRAMVEQMMKQRMPQQPAAAPVTEVRKTSEADDKNGYPSVKYQLYRDGRLSKDIWVTDWDNVEGGKDAIRAFEDFADFMKELQAAMPSFAQSPESGNNAYEHLEELGGFPVVTIDYADDGSIEGESRLKTSRVDDVDPASFEAPAGYTRQEMFR